MIRLGRLDIREDGATAEVRIPVTGLDGPPELRYLLPAAASPMISGLLDGPLLALLLPAMAAGRDIEVQGEVSARLLYHLVGPYQRLLQAVIPTLHRIRIHAGRADRVPSRATGVATGVSGGIDSFSVLADHHYGDPPPGFRLTHLLYHNVGSHGRAGGDLFRRRAARMAPLAERLGLPLLVVDSNLDAFYGPGLGFMQTHTPRNASVPLLLQEGIGRYYYAASYHWRDSVVGPSPGMARSDPVALPMLSTERLECHAVGGEWTRVEKTIRVADLAESWRFLDVCTSADADGNCSVCAKCLRTLLTLDLASLLDRFADAFDLAAYRRHRSRHIARTLASDYPLDREIASFARERGIVLPVRARAQAATRRALRRLFRR